jgi:DNA-binding CsgD family transcriptional regulator
LSPGAVLGLCEFPWTFSRQIGEHSGLGNADVASMITLVASAGDPHSAMSVGERKELFFHRLSRLVPADGWMWSVSQVGPAASESIAIDVLDGGWSSQRERKELLDVIGQAAVHEAVESAALQTLRGQCDLTFCRNDLMDEQTWQRCGLGKAWRAAGFDHFVISILPLDASSYSGVWLCRKVHAQPFSSRDCQVLCSLFKHTAWLHQHSTEQTASVDLLTLSPRERDVLVRLLKGDSRKQVATKLNLSIHTVADHLKVIYRKLGVTSRAELLAKFISRGH